MQPVPTKGKYLKEVPTKTEDLQASMLRIKSTTRGDYQEVYCITNMKTESRVLGTITLKADLKNIKDQQASSANNI
jgi:hypothetical protein